MDNKIRIEAAKKDSLMDFIIERLNGGFIFISGDETGKTNVATNLPPTSVKAILQVVIESADLLNDQCKTDADTDATMKNALGDMYTSQHEKRSSTSEELRKRLSNFIGGLPPAEA